MSNNTYNGWTNYATWRVNLEIFDGMTVRDVTGRSIVPVSDLKDYLQEYAEEVIETTSSEGLARDYAFAFLSEVNWWELANAMLADEEAEEDEEESEEV
jgi:hypothetical protein